MAGKIDVGGMVAEVLKIGPRNLIGLDLGFSSIKVCELAHLKNGNFKLVKFATIPIPEGSFIEDEIQRPEDIVESIKEAVQASGIKNKNMAIGMYGPNTVAKKLTLASDEDIEDQVMWESEQYIPFGVDDSTISYHVFGQNLGGGTDVIVAAARNDILESYVDLIDQAGYKVKIADLQHFCLANIFEHVYKDMISNPDESFLLLDFGAQKTNLVIYRNFSIIYTKEINVGGVIITEEIQRQMQLSYFEAEDLKIRGDEKGNLPQEIVDIINASLENFYEEIKKSLNFFMHASSEDSLNHCFVTGGNSLIPGLMEGLEGILGIEVKFLNPFDAISFDEKNFSEEELSYIASNGVIAMGLAMRSLDE